MNYIRVIFFLASLLFITIKLNAQEQKCAINAGIGKYELLNAGVTLKLTPVNEISFSAGYNFMITGNESYSSKLEYRYLFKFRNAILKNTYIGVKALYWKHKDDYFIWEACSGSVLVGKKVFLTKKSGIAIDVGFISSFYLNHTRLNYDQVGWPRMYNHSANISYFYFF